MIVDRERQITSFVAEEYWSIEAELAKSRVKRRTKPDTFRAALVGYLDKKDKLELHNKEETEGLVAELEGARYHVGRVVVKDVPRHPAPPFITSTLQQEAWRRFNFSAKRTMALAQQLYEGLPLGAEGPVGLITYMRTDSTTVAASAVAETRAYISRKYGADYLPRSPRRFTRKVKGAQEAHEAIRPTSVEREPQSLKSYLNRDQSRLYELIWKRMVASQMASAILKTTTVDVEARPQGMAPGYLFRARDSVVKFPGFIALYGEGKDEAGDGEHPLPELSQGELLELRGLYPEQHFTEPPPRYNEASLIRALEENGIGRPSTYAPILSTIQERGYVEKEERRLKPTELGTIVSDLLTQHFADIVDIGFTAQMEEDLDQIARGQREWVPVLQEFYGPFAETVQRAALAMPRVKPAEEVTDQPCPECGRPMVIKYGRYGKFLSCPGYPQCRGAKPLLVSTGVKCPKCGGEVVERRSKRGRRFYGCANFPKCDFATWQRPLPQPCPKCGGLLHAYGRQGARCTQCGYKGRARAVEKVPAAVGK